MLRDAREEITAFADFPQAHCLGSAVECPYW
jgi:hypothetical protein